MYKRRILYVLVVWLLSSVAFSQQVKITGIVSDSLTYKHLLGVVVRIQPGYKAVVTDEAGRFSLTVNKGKYRLDLSYLGYHSRRIDIDAQKDQLLTIELASNTVLNEIVVLSKGDNRQITSLTMGVNQLSSNLIKQIPALMGEVDPLKVIQLLPGVQSVGDGGTGFSVRGGNPDQNLLLFDNATIYNASHLLGFFSVFNNDVLQGMDLYKGNLPAKYGGRLASLLDIRTKTDIPEKLQGTGGIGLISSRLALENRMGKKASWLIGGRRSYADLFLKASSDRVLRNTELYFYDMNGKFRYRFSEKDLLEWNGYLGKDKYGAQHASFLYGNGASSLRWSHAINPNRYASYSLLFSNYDYTLISNLNSSKFHWNSGITDFAFRADFSQSTSRGWQLAYGASSTYHAFNPGIVLLADQGLDDYKMDKKHSFEWALYASNEQAITDKLSVSYGLRLTAFQNMGKTTEYTYDAEYNAVDSTTYAKGKIYNTFLKWEPRLGAVWKISALSSIKANFSRNVQYIQLANNSTFGSPLDIWFSSSANVKPQTAQIFSVGYFQNAKDGMYEFSIETYYKRMNHVIDFKDHADLVLNKRLDGEIRSGKGKSYGVELMIAKNKGRLTGFVNYTLSHTDRTIPGINDGKTYLSPYDKTHALNVVSSYRFSNKYTASANWTYSTGMPATYPTGRFEINGEYFPIYSSRNAYRRPDYHRLDLSLTYVRNPNSTKRWKGEWVFSLYNAYGKKNPWLIVLKQNQGSTPYAEMLYLFGAVPSVTYNFKF